MYEGFFSPAATGGLIWGAGPILQLNSASNASLGSGRTSAGPAIVVLRQSGPWSIGALLTQVCSFAGDDQRADVSQLQLQPLLSYTLDPKHTLGFSGTLVANWHARTSSEIWTVPLGMTYSILTRRPGSIPINFIFGGGYNIVGPREGGTSYVRFQVNLIFAKSR